MGVQAAKLEQIRALQNSEYAEKMKAARAYLKESVYPFLDEINAEESKIKDIMNKQKEEKKKFVCILALLAPRWSRVDF